MSEFIIGLTGGIGSGKSTVTAMFEALGIDIIDADIIARTVVQPNSAALHAIAEHFGDSYINADGQLNRALLRTRIFSNTNDKEWLNNLLHPIIRAELVQQTAAANSPYCILVAPLLIENNLMPLIDRLLVVDVSEATQIKRTLLRDTSNTDEIKAIIASQTSREHRLSLADDIICNDANNTENNVSNLLLDNVHQLHRKYLSLA
ncbi:dephospho-CoA kinase [Colwellia sp. D2M02]|uniref:dephospho-CoA kinase n=1 Tax=Colwellia sp. D2M02 TaxID=2841562 RepID=UPI001C09048A|nr:dephospho-CoA kinase [Colwellia sp. D2M02]MBU2894824.1 dephospho-CoA kinase [Colwellia sp. D2M02]